MPARLGIEVSRSACRIVELERVVGDEPNTIVQSYTQSAGADAVSLAPYRGRHAAVVIWGLHAEHRQVVVASGSYQRMRREAVSATRQTGVDTRHMLADIAAIGDKNAYRRPVVVALAHTNNVAAALRMFTSAGVKVRSIVTPGLALMSLARMRRRLTAAASVEVYVAFEEANTAIALIRDGALMAARELEWGYRSAAGVRPREDAARRIGDAITGFLGDCGIQPNLVAQVCVCGGMPELRGMTLPLMERLDVEVEPLDSLFGIDADRLPDPADDFRERVADLRLAWAVAGDWNAPIDFLRERRRRMAKTTLTRAAVAAGVITGLAIAWRLQRSDVFQPSAPPVKAPVAPPRTVAVAPPPRPPVAAAPPPEAPPTVPAVKAPAPVVTLTPVPPRPASGPARVDSSTAAPLRLSPVPEPPASAAARDRPPTEPTATTRAPAVARRPAVDEAPAPFDASLGTILYGSDRRLAIVDGRIVQIGDDVRGARVIDIMPDAVLFRDVQGRLRKLTLQDSRR
jgi:hypothetical protein